MSNYFQKTKHPVTGVWENATWHDNAMGPRQYGVTFPSNPDMMYNAEEYKLETEKTPPKTWEEKFDEEFVHMRIGNDMHDRPLLYDTKTDGVDSLKSFIRSLLASQLKEIEEEVEKYKCGDHKRLLALIKNKQKEI